MADWKRYMNNKYQGCHRLAYARDHIRMRDVSIYLIPGEFEDVGISDGVDVWIAPVSADCFSVNVKRLIEDIKAGKGLPKAVPLGDPNRRRVLITADAPPAPSIAPRRRALIESPLTPQSATKARRARID